MRSEIPRWVISGIALWGRQKRRIWIGTDWHGNIDGYAESLLGRIREERDGASQGERKQHWPEVFWGNGLEVQRCLPGMRETPLRVLHLHYVFEPAWALTVDMKAKYAGITKAEYWRELENAETWVHAKLDSVSPCQPLQNPLQDLPESSKVQEPIIRVGKLSPAAIDWAALRRSKITLA